VPNYSVELKPSAKKELDRLSSTLTQRIFPRLRSLASDPRPPGCKKLKGSEHHWRIRVGDYRIVYTIDDRRRLVEVTRIRHRNDVYDY
jgi:mRNA interferase RelE/StbE